MPTESSHLLKRVKMLRALWKQLLNGLRRFVIATPAIFGRARGLCPSFGVRVTTSRNRGPRNREPTTESLMSRR